MSVRSFHGARAVVHAVGVLLVATACQDLSVVTKPDDPVYIPVDTEVVDSDTPTTLLPELVYAPELLPFGYVPEGDTSTLSVLVSNEGEADLIVQDLAITGSAAFSWSMDDDPLVVAPGAAGEIRVTYTATAGDDTGTLGFSSNDPYQPAGHVLLTGTGADPGLVVVPDPLHFGDVLVGDAASEVLTLSNPGNSTVTVTGFTSSEGAFAIPPLGAPLVLDPGTSTSVDVVFQPVDPQPYAGTITVASDSRVPVAPVGVDGRGVARPEAVCDADPPLLSALGATSTFVGHDSVDPQGSPLTYDWRLVRAPTGSVVTLAGLGAGADRGPITPDLAGAYVAELVVTNDLGLSSDPCVATLRVDAIPVVEAVPDPLDFGGVSLATSSQRDLTVRNVGNTPVTVSDVISGDSHFTLTSPGSTVLVPGATVAVPVRFTPTDLPTVSGTLVVVSTAPSATATATGHGIASQPEADCAAVPPVVSTLGGVTTLQGSGSTDPQGRPLTYAWTLTGVPSGSTLSLVGTGTGADRGPLVPDLAGTYTASLVVTNDLGLASAPCATSFSVDALPRVVAWPDPLDFGDVTPGGGSTRQLNVRNTGNAPATVTAVDSSNGRFQASPFAATSLAPGQSLVVDVGFRPTVLGAVSGTLTVVSTAPPPAATVTVTGRGVADAPVADCRVVPPVISTLNGTATFVGSGSSDPQGRTLTYVWTLTGSPAGSALAMPAGGADRGPVTPDLAGTYTASLVVTNDLGLTSAPCTTALQVDPIRRIEATPDPLAFGTVQVGQQLTRALTLTSTGNAPVTVTGLSSSNSRFLTGTPGVGSLAPGASTTVDVTFAPDSDGSVTSTLTVQGNASPAASVTATGNGQGLDPVAVCRADPTTVVAIHETFDLIGHDSYDPLGRPLTYEWVRTERPTGSSWLIGGGTTADRGPFTPEVVGTYRARLIVTNDLGRSSAPCFAELYAEPNADLWIEMFWEHAGDDMDLHLIRDGAQRNDSNDDCYYSNCVGGGPRWGVAGTADDPFLDLDDIHGDGPENINIARPADGAYRVEVRDFPQSVYNGANDVTVRVYIAGVLVFEDTRTVTGEDSWTRFVRIDWANGTGRVTPL
ncbi:MAG: choice-of-anchor D domain-containing protein [Alphaproteobacteria bacterium]|nr:choice-of-anchor D domain-containing protein [Alphaproteobacteria bacterium]